MANLIDLMHILHNHAKHFETKTWKVTDKASDKN